jgi:hypothetical protein
MRTDVRRLLLAAALPLCAALAAEAADIRVETPAGPLIITTRDDDVVVTVRAGGKQIEVDDAKTGQKLTLVDGKLHQKPTPDSTVVTSQFSLKRGEKVVAEVRPEAQALNLPPAVEPVAPGTYYEAVTTYQYDADTKTYTPITRYIARNWVAAPALVPAVGLPPQSDEPRQIADSPTADFSKFETEEALQTYANTVEATKDDAKIVAVMKEYVRRYPEGSSATLAQRKIGLAYWRLAKEEDSCGRREDGPGAQAHFALKKKYLEESRTAFSAAEQTYLARAVNGEKLSDRDFEHLKQAAFWGADCDFWLGQYDEANRRYAALAVRYRDCPEELIAESQQFNCLNHLRRSSDAEALLGLMKRRIEAVRFKEGDDLPALHKKGYWENWLVEASVQIRADVPPTTTY